MVTTEILDILSLFKVHFLKPRVAHNIALYATHDIALHANYKNIRYYISAKVHFFKPRVAHNIALHASHAARKFFFLICAFRIHSASVSPHSSSDIKVVCHE